MMPHQTLFGQTGKKSKEKVRLMSWIKCWWKQFSGCLFHICIIHYQAISLSETALIYICRIHIQWILFISTLTWTSRMKSHWSLWEYWDFGWNENRTNCSSFVISQLPHYWLFRISFMYWEYAARWVVNIWLTLTYIHPITCPIHQNINIHSN